MGLFKRLAGILGLAKDEDQHHRDTDAAASGAAPPPFSVPPAAAATAASSAQHLPRRGFSVPVQVPVERGPPAPLLVFCPAGDGGIQVCSARNRGIVSFEFGVLDLRFDIVDGFLAM